jgi:hypothetical protein
MKISLPEYGGTALALLAGAAVTLCYALATDRGDISSAALFLAGTALFAAGIFALTFLREQGIDPAIAALLTPPGTLTAARLCADLGVQGKARILPAPQGLMQFIPVDPRGPVPPIRGDYSYSTDPAGPGILIPPAGLPLLDLLERRNALALPAEEPAVFEAIREVFTGITALADTADIRRTDNDVILTLTGFRLLPGCALAHAQSPKSCLMAPCPACSLAACMLAKARASAIGFESVRIDPKEEVLQLILSVPPPVAPSLPPEEAGLPGGRFF